MIHANGKEIVTATCKNRWTALHCACIIANPSLEIIQYLVGIGGEGLVTATSRPLGKTALHHACRSANPSLEIIQYLVGVGGEGLVTAATYRHGRTALHYACESENPSLEIIQYLVSVGGEGLVTAATHGGETALHYACTNDNSSFQIIKFLIKSGGCSIWNTIADLVVQREQHFRGTTILHLAIVTGAPQNVLRDLITHFDDCIGAEDSNGRYPIHTAIEAGLKWENGTQKMVEHTGETGIIRRTDPVTGLYPFMLAAAGDQFDVSSVYELLRMDTNCFVQTISYLPSASKRLKSS